MDNDRRKKNVRLAIALGALALFVLISSLPFWQGLVRFAVSGGQ